MLLLLTEQNSEYHSHRNAMDPQPSESLLKLKATTGLVSSTVVEHVALGLISGTEKKKGREKLYIHVLQNNSLHYRHITKVPTYISLNTSSPGVSKLSCLRNSPIRLKSIPYLSHSTSIPVFTLIYPICPKRMYISEKK